MEEQAVAYSAGKFFGVYLLCSQSTEKRYNGKCYIGYTVNPNRRINQHNRGKDFGGARKTSNKGPWQMVMIVHGFPNNIAALQFEWAWQQPALSSRLKDYTELRRKQPKESCFQYNFRVLSRMLRVGPWNRLPLCIQWLETNYEKDFDYSMLPPSHMQIVSGKITIQKSAMSKAKDKGHATEPPRPVWAFECHLCMQPIDRPERTRIGCLNNLCKLTCHIVCLANHMIANDECNRGHYIPIGGQCPLCETTLQWSELLQRKTKLQGLVGDNCAFPEDDYIDEEQIECISDEEEDDDDVDNNNFNDMYA